MGFPIVCTRVKPACTHGERCGDTHPPGVGHGDIIDSTRTGRSSAMGHTTDTIKKGIKDATGAVKKGVEKGKDAAVRAVTKGKAAASRGADKVQDTTDRAADKVKHA